MYNFGDGHVYVFLTVRLRYFILSLSISPLLSTLHPPSTISYAESVP